MIVIADTSVVVKWFHAEEETEVEQSRAILAAHRNEILTAHILDLGVYELGNVLLRALHWSASDTADQIGDLMVICGPPLVPTPQCWRDATTLAHQHRLTFYDALFPAVARGLDAPLISMDAQLLAADLAETPANFVSRLGLVS